MRVLVVDDNPDAADTFSILLKLWGHEVRSAHDGVSALALASSFQPRIVFLDIGLPLKSGYEVALELRRVPGMEQVFLVAMTGFDRSEDRLRATEAGFDHHMPKPVDPGTVEALLADPRITA